MNPPLSILFIDDDLFEMLPFIDRLESEGYKVTCKTTIEEASLWLADGHQPSLVICDLMIVSAPTQTPEGARSAGINFIRNARERHLSGVPIVILTGVLLEEVLREAHELTPWIVNKPTYQSELVRVVREALASGPSNH